MTGESGPDLTDDDELLRRIGTKDAAAFGLIYDRYSPLLLALSRKILNDPREAEDSLQEAFVCIWQRAQSYDSTLGAPFHWLLTIARNKAIERARSRGRYQRLVDEMGQRPPECKPVPPSGLYEATQSESITRMRAALESLSAEQREAIELAFLEGRTQQEISEILREPIGTVKARIRRGLLKLRASLSKE